MKTKETTVVEIKPVNIVKTEIEIVGDSPFERI